MPNWCETEYVAKGDVAEITDLYEKLESLENRAEPLVENGFGKLWLGCLVVLLGGDRKGIYCRGQIYDYELEEDKTTLNFRVESAWSELDGVRHFLQEKYPSIKFYYRSEEPGMEEYYTNDEEGEVFPEKVKVEKWGDGDGAYYCDTWEEAYDNIEQLIGVKVTSPEQAKAVTEAYNEEHEDEPLFVNEFQIIID